MQLQHSIDEVRSLLGVECLGAGGDRRGIRQIGCPALRQLELHEFGEGGRGTLRARGMHGIEPGEQASDHSRMGPFGQQTIEFADAGDGTLQRLLNILQTRQYRYGRPEAGPFALIFDPS